MIASLAVCGHVAGQDEPLLFPSPLAGPGAPLPRRSKGRRIDKAWKHLADGNLADAAKRAAKTGDSPAARLLRAQIALVEGTGGVRTELDAITSDLPRYAAAWLTLSVAAERDGAEAEALAAARRGAELWPNKVWADRVDNLHQRLVEQRVAGAGVLLEQGDPQGALEMVRRSLALEPEHREGRLLVAHALLADGQVEAAESVLASLGSDPDALFLAGLIAEERHDWQTAMDLFASVPADMPERNAALNRVQRRWRLNQLPAHIQEALASPRLTRAQLAALLVGMVPRLEAIGGGNVPVLPDVVDDASQRQILIAVRLGLLDVDPLEQRFHPDHTVAPPEVRESVDRLCHLIGLRPPVWCDPSAVISSTCTALADPPTGESVAELVLALEQGVSP